EAEKIDFQKTPMFLVAPYLFVEANDTAARKNISLISKAIEKKGQDKIYAQLVLSQLFLEKEGLTSVLDEYAKQGVSGYLVWVDDYSEHAKSASSLVKYASIFKKLKAANKEAFTLYGGYFS